MLISCIQATERLAAAAHCIAQHSVSVVWCWAPQGRPVSHLNLTSRRPSSSRPRMRCLCTKKKHKSGCWTGVSISRRTMARLSRHHVQSQLEGTINKLGANCPGQHATLWGRLKLYAQTFSRLHHMWHEHWMQGCLPISFLLRWTLNHRGLLFQV